MFPMPPPQHPLQERLERYYQQQKQQAGDSARRAAAAAEGLGNAELARSEKLSKGDASRGSTAERGDLSVAEIKRQQAAEESSQDREVQTLIERGKGAEEAGKANVAKIYYRQAASRASGSLREELLAKVQALGK
jgi:hypothetical protein